MMPASATAAAHERARDVARWLRVLEAVGARVPAISLLPGTTRELLAAETEPAQLMRACLRAIDAVDRQMTVERARATFNYPCPDPRASGAIEWDGLQSRERQAIFKLIREQLAEIVASIARADPG